MFLRLWRLSVLLLWNTAKTVKTTEAYLLILTHVLRYIMKNNIMYFYRENKIQKIK